MREPYHTPSFLDALGRADWHQQANCRDEVDPECFFPARNVDQRWPGTARTLLPLLVCSKCSVRRECLKESLGSWNVPHADRRSSTIVAVGVWGGSSELERQAVRHLPLEEAVERLEAGFPKRLAERVEAFRIRDRSKSRSHGPRVRRVRALLAKMAEEA
jgi:hypothetical protein